MHMYKKASPFAGVRVLLKQVPAESSLSQTGLCTGAVSEQELLLSWYPRGSTPDETILLLNRLSCNDRLYWGARRLELVVNCLGAL